MATPQKRRRRSGGGGGGNPRIEHTSVPTGRAAYAETREWLLHAHGPVCAYCGRTFPALTLTLDHVTPRRGQSAYDRRDNLVLACKTCNTAKADKSFLAWVLGGRARARHLYMYGQHLSDGILDILRPMVGDEVVLPPPKPAKRPRKKSAKELFGAHPHDGGESPYGEPSPYSDAEPQAPRKPIRTVGARTPAKPVVKTTAAVHPASAAPAKRRRRRGGRGRGGAK